MFVLRYAVGVVALLLTGASSPVLARDGVEAASQKEEPDKDDAKPESSKRWRIHWDKGPIVTSRENRFEMRFGAEVQNDTAGFANRESVEDVVGEFSGGVEWRRARLTTTGTFLERFEFKLNYDFAVTSPPQLKDAYFGIVKLPFEIPLKILSGRFQAPLGLEGAAHNTSLTFLERSTMTTAFLPNRNTGFLFWNSTARRIRYGFAVLKPADELGVGDSDNLGYSGRFSSAFLARGDRLLVHAGANFYRRNISDTVSFKSRPESHIAPAFVDTGKFAADHVHTAVLEGALRRGPTLFQGEVAYTTVGTTDTRNPKFWGFYVEGSHFLTGEIRRYDSRRGSFRPVPPKRELRDEGGLGAFQIALRFSHLDLTDNGIRGGVLDDISAGLNWHLTSYGRVMTNVIWSKLEGAEPVWVFQVRLQVQI